MTSQIGLLLIQSGVTRQIQVKFGTLMIQHEKKTKT